MRDFEYDYLKDELGVPLDNIHCWQDVCDLFHNFSWVLEYDEYINSIIRALKKNKNNYNLIDIPFKEGLRVVEKLEGKELQKFIFQHIKVTETEYIKNQEKLSKYYNILKRNNPELRASSIKLINELNNNKIGLCSYETKSEVLERNQNQYALATISKYTVDEIKNNISAFGWGRILYKYNTNGFKYTKYFKTEVIEDLLEKGIWEEILKDAWEDSYSSEEMNRNQLCTGKSIITDTKYQDVILFSTYSFPPLGLYDGTKYKYSDFYKNFKYNFEKYCSNISNKIRNDSLNNYVFYYRNIEELKKLKTVLRFDSTSRIFTNLLKEDISLNSIEKFIFILLVASYDGALPSNETVKSFVDIYKEFLNHKEKVIDYLQSEEYLSQEKSLDSLKLEEWEEVLNTVKNRE